MLKGTLLLSSVLLGSFLMSGCSTTADYITIAKVSKNEPVVTIIADQDSTSLGFLNVGNVRRKNYLYAFGIAAQTTIDNGFKYFTIIEPKELIQQYEDRNVHNLEDAYDACDKGKHSFHMGTNTIASVVKYNRCDHIVVDSHQNTLTGGTVRHSSIHFQVEMHNDPRPNSNATFEAQKVLHSELLKDLNKEYFKANER